MSPQSKPERLPFEPAKNRSKSDKVTPKSTNVAPQTSGRTSNSEQIPEVVSRRMARRMAIFSGVPTGLGMLIFIASYLLVVNHWLDIPPIVTLLSSLGAFGLGVLGLSYGVLSASWDERQVGSRIGWDEFKVNFGRTTEAWRSPKQPKK
jgi:Photosynthesis affected mutant 68